MTEHFNFQPVMMTERRNSPQLNVHAHTSINRLRKMATSNGSADHCSSSSCGVKKQKISIVTHKWQSLYNRQYNVCFACIATRTVKTGRLFLLCGAMSAESTRELSLA